MFLSRLVAVGFVLIVGLFVILATVFRDPADTATRLPADLDVQTKDLPTEPFDVLAAAYADFDVEVAAAATQQLVSQILNDILAEVFELSLPKDEVEALVMEAVEESLDDKEISDFNRILTFGVPTVEAEEGAQSPEPEEMGNVLVLTAQEQRVVNFGDAIADAAAEVFLGLQLQHSPLMQALEAAELQTPDFGVNLKPKRVQRVAYLSVPVETYVPQVEVTGSTAANRRTEVRARTGSTVESILAERGDFVETGQILLTLENDGRDAQRAQTLASIAQAEASLISANAQYSQAQTSLNDAQENQDDVLALGEFASETQRRNAASAVDQATQSLAVAQAGLAQAEATLAQAQASLVQIDLDIERLTIRAPFAGRLETRHVELGAAINPGDPVFTLTDLQTMLAKAQVSDAVRQSLNLGDRAQVTIGDGATAQVVAGPITLIDTTSNAATRTFEVEVELANTLINGQPTIVDNQFASLKFNQAPVEVVRVPQSALTSASITADAQGTTGLLTINDQGRVVFTEITFADYANGGELILHADRVGGQDIRLIVGRGGFVKIGDLVDGREALKSN